MAANANSLRNSATNQSPTRAKLGRRQERDAQISSPAANASTTNASTTNASAASAPVETTPADSTLEAQLQIREAELIVTAFRTLVILLAIGAPRVFGLTGSYEINGVWLAAIAGIYNVAAGLSCLRPGRYGLRRSFMVVMDMMLITLWIRLSGQWELFPIYFLVVVVAAMWFKVLGGALAAVWCNFFFLFVWGRFAADSELMHVAPFTTSMALGALLLFLVGCLAGYIAEIQERERERRLESQLLVANYQREIDLSSQLQSLLLSSGERHELSFDIGVASQSARELGGGDYVDAIPLTDHKTLICIADVSGKSVRAQARLPLLKYALRAFAPLHSDPAELVMRLNQTLAPDLQPELYIAFCCAVLDEKTGTLAWCNAGHIAPLLVRGEAESTQSLESVHSLESVSPLETSGPPLGLFPEATYATREMKWRKTDQLLFFTDGLSDALSFNHTEDGETQVRRLAARLAHETDKPVEIVADDFIALAGAAFDAAESLPERLRTHVEAQMSFLRARRERAVSTPAFHRDDITVVVVRAKLKSSSLNSPKPQPVKPHPVKPQTTKTV